ncbi:hydrolethalus syndrome protein 1 homolog [Parambassis ranga]|uniref:Hydrolethalus syndrome protein 1 homolog n=1 Tax=Parambassis ranga TaxID=210632 RepID=A0A6P7IPF7_9TELE|nr:hydrolethalus syndrome protein 1 [Parambassis ranga]
MDNLAFSEEEIQEQLATLGYKNIPTHKLLEFKQDLDELIRRGEWRNLASSTERDSSSQRTRSQPGPPAFTKEKVGQYYFDGSSEQFFLHADKTDSDRPNRDCREQKGHCDSYAQYTVAAKLQLPSGASARLRVEPDLENTPQSQVSDSYTSSPDSHGGHFIKRKVLRKHKGQSFVCDESVYSEDAASCLEEQLDKLHLSAPRDSEVEGEDVMDHSDTQSSDTGDISLSAFESYIRQMTRTQSDVELRPRPKSFIRPVMSRQTIKKTDPVARYFQYKEHWNMFNLPREKDRRFIRWEIKERLAYQPPPPKPQKVFVPNTYIVPTEKKRSALRWSVRNDLANGLLPHKLGYRS